MKSKTKKELLEENIILQNRVDYYMTKASNAETGEQSLQKTLIATQNELEELTKLTTDRIAPLEKMLGTMREDLVKARNRADTAMRLLGQLSDLANLGVDLIRE